MSMKKEYDYKGYHATADIVLKKYPKNMIEIFRDCIKYSNLNIVSEHIHNFTEDSATGVYILAESHASIHEYAENQYVTCDIYTCGKEGDPKLAIENFINKLDEIVGVEKSKVQFFNRGVFDNITISMAEKAFFNTDIKEVNEMQEKMNKISSSLSPDQLKYLNEIIEWCSYEKICDNNYSDINELLKY